MRLFLTSLFLLATMASGPLRAEDVPPAPNTLTEKETQEGWKLLFDGKTIPTAWRGLQKVDPYKDGWVVKDGELRLPKDIKDMGKVTGGDLFTTESWTDFDFSFEWKLTVSANTGVRYLVRQGPNHSAAGFEYQIIDDVHHPEGLKGGPIRRTGALDGILEPAKDKKLNEAEHWNMGHIAIFGRHVEHWLNGEKVLEYDLGSRELMTALMGLKPRPPTYYGSKFATPLVLLDQGDEVSFRSLKIRPLVQQPAIVPTTASRPDGTAPDVK